MTQKECVVEKYLIENDFKLAETITDGLNFRKSYVLQFEKEVSINVSLVYSSESDFNNSQIDYCIWVFVQNTVLFFADDLYSDDYVDYEDFAQALTYEITIAINNMSQAYSLKKLKIK